MLYIHQFPDWTHFRFDPKRVLDALGRTRLAEGRLIGMVELCKFRGFETELLATDIVSSCAIDGIELSPAAVKKDIDLRGEGKNNSVKNYIGAIRNASTPLTIERLFNWHAALSANKAMQCRDSMSTVARLINEDNVSFTGPDPDRLQTELANFITWFEITPMDGAIKAAISHFWFLTLRPFNEGNGRLARMITSMQLARSESTQHYLYSLNAQILKNRYEYFRILNRAQSGNGDLTEWILWFLAQMYEAVLQSESKYAPMVRRISFANQHAGTSTSEREQTLLIAIFNGTIPENFTAKEVAALFNTSHDTALREIQNMIGKKLIRASSKGGRSQKYSLAE